MASGGEADQLRKSMATFKFTGGVSKFKEELVSGMAKNGYSPEFAEKTFSQLEGFGSYGFPESHAASFALIQREGEVVHLIAQQLFDLSGDLSALADRDGAFKLPTGRGDEFAHGAPGSPNSRDRAPAVKPRDVFVPDLQIDTLKVKSRNCH
ncbi:hypothetical protein ABIA10_006549 [Rhizobium leguminosarum]|jgi:hypothetical protein